MSSFAVAYGVAGTSGGPWDPDVPYFIPAPTPPTIPIRPSVTIPSVPTVTAPEIDAAIARREQWRAACPSPGHIVDAFGEGAIAALKQIRPAQ